MFRRPYTPINYDSFNTDFNQTGGIYINNKKQIGFGIASMIFKTLGRWVLPLFKKTVSTPIIKRKLATQVLPFVKKHVAPSAVNLAADVGIDVTAKKKKLKSSLKEHLPEAGINIARSVALEKIKKKNPQFGGKKRRKKKKINYKKILNTTKIIPGSLLS